MKLIYNQETKEFSITNKLQKTFSYVYDEFGNELRIGDDVIFYYQKGKESRDSDKSVGRLYRGEVVNWDKRDLTITIETLEFDRSEYGLRKLVEIDQRLVSKLK